MPVKKQTKKQNSVNTEKSFRTFNSAKLGIVWIELNYSDFLEGKPHSSIVVNSVSHGSKRTNNILKILVYKNFLCYYQKLLIGFSLSGYPTVSAIVALVTRMCLLGETD